MGICEISPTNPRRQTRESDCARFHRNLAVIRGHKHRSCWTELAGTRGHSVYVVSVILLSRVIVPLLVT